MTRNTKVPAWIIMIAMILLGNWAGEVMKDLGVALWIRGLIGLVGVAILVVVVVVANELRHRRGR